MRILKATKPNSILCKLGFHRKDFHREHFTNFFAKTIERYQDTYFCGRCGKVVETKAYKWNGKEMVETSEVLY